MNSIKKFARVFFVNAEEKIKSSLHSCQGKKRYHTLMTLSPGLSFPDLAVTPPGLMFAMKAPSLCPRSLWPVKLMPNPDVPFSS